MRTYRIAQTATALAAIMTVAPAQAQQGPAQSMVVPSLPQLTTPELPVKVEGNRISLTLAQARTPLGWALNKAMFGKFSVSSEQFGVALEDDELQTPTRMWLQTDISGNIHNVAAKLSLLGDCDLSGNCWATTTLAATLPQGPLAEGVARASNDILKLQKEELTLSLSTWDVQATDLADLKSLRLGWQTTFAGEARHGSPQLGLSASCGWRDCHAGFNLRLSLSPDR
ncbi:MAG: hypothetical protein H6922_03270 [Pseudomonadaceae bacterium]|nr:hypothetical protein [Pseudomonadaceae bacterium]